MFKIFGSSLFVIPTELSTGGNNIVAEVRTDADGEATFTVYGENLTATPVVYDANTVSDNLNSAGTRIDDEYSKTALQAEAPAVKYSKIDALKVSVVAEGTANSAEYVATPFAYNQNSVGGRTYTVTVTDKDGKLAPEGSTAYVTFEKDNFFGSVYFTTAKENFRTVVQDVAYAITVGKDGKATFRVAGSGATSFAKPTVFLNTAGNEIPAKLNKEDVQQVAEVTYFKSPVVKNAVIKVKDANGNEITSTTAGTEAYVTYQSVDQNGFAYRPTTANYQLAFDVTSTFGNAIVTDNVSGSVLNPSQNLGNTKTYQVVSNSTGEATIRVTTTSADTVTVNVTGANGILPTQAATVSFTNSNVIPSIFTGDAKIDAVKDEITFAKTTGGFYQSVSYANASFAEYGLTIDKDKFESLISEDNDDDNLYSEVTAIRDANGNYKFDYRGSGNPLPTTPASKCNWRC